MSQAIKLTAVGTIAPGKETRFKEIFGSVAAFVEKEEPFVLKYELITGRTEPASEGTEVVIREIYESKDAFDKHMKGEKVVNFVKAIQEEKLLLGMKLIFDDGSATVGIPPRL